MPGMTTRIRSCHTIILERPIDDCFPLFTAKGEERWVPGWRPQYVHPPSGEAEPGQVFITGEGDERTWWTVVDFDPVAHHARYSRVTPASRIGLVDVRCRRVSELVTEVEVRYEMTALNAAGVAALQAYAGAAYVAMIEDWKRLIDAAD